MIPGPYSCALIDTPWSYQNFTDAKNGAAVSAMETQDSGTLEEYPINAMLAKNALVFSWGVYPKMDEYIDLHRAWGLQYVTAVPWTKTSPSSGNISTGIGFWTQGTSEFLGIWRKGKAGRKPGKHKPVKGLLVGDRLQPHFWAPKGGIHSEKPEEIRAWIERIVNGPYVEIFARECRPGWDCIGLDVGWRITRGGVFPIPCGVPGLPRVLLGQPSEAPKNLGSGDSAPA